MSLCNSVMLDWGVGVNLRPLLNNFTSVFESFLDDKLITLVSDLTFDSATFCLFEGLPFEKN